MHDYLKCEYMKGYKVNEDFFDKIDSEIKAYLLGFFVADGCITMNSGCKNSYCLSVNLTKEDEYIIKLFNDYICPNNHIRNNNHQTKGMHRRETSIIKWTSTKMKETLFNYNIRMRKTYDFTFVFPFEKIQKEYIWDFIRGFFDGDGHISYSETTKQLTFAFYGTSKPYLNQLGEMFEKEFGVEKRIESTTKTNIELFCLRFSANYNRVKFMENLFYKFYKNKKFLLKRKQEKILNYLTFKYRDNQSDCERLIDIVERRE